MSDSAKECPSCKSSENVIPIVYGKPGTFFYSTAQSILSVPLSNSNVIIKGKKPNNHPNNTKDDASSATGSSGSTAVKKMPHN